MSLQCIYNVLGQETGICPQCGLHIKGMDVHFEISHAEVLGDALNIGRILDTMRSVKEIDARGCSPIFWDMRLNRRQQHMLRTSGWFVGSVRLRKLKMEDAHSLEKTTMQIKDQSRKVPEPIVVLATINGLEVRALIDTGSMANFVSTTIVEQLKLKKEVYTKPLSVQLAVHGS